MKQEKKSVFCPVPWKHGVLATDGAYLSCAIAASTEEGGLVRDPSGEVMRAGRHSLADFRNSAPLKELRRNMLEGRETPSVCRRCIEEEKHGLPFRRKLELDKNYFTEEEARACTAADGTIDTTATPIAVFNVRPGNFCNLRCRICGPAQSSAWYDEWYDNYHRGFRDSGVRYAIVKKEGEKTRLENSPYHWFKESGFAQEILGSLGGLREIHFSGGEPLISPDHLSLLKKIVESECAGEITLDYNTNLTVLPDQLLDLWRPFRQVRLGVSVDGLGAVNDYIRPPSRFSEILANLERLGSAGENIHYWITSTISSLNVGRYPELVEWVMNSPLPRLNEGHAGFKFLSHHNLRKPSELCIRALPPEAKAVVRSRFEEFLAGNRISVKQNAQYAREQLLSMLEFMEAESGDEAAADQFIRETEKMDRYRGVSFAEIDPDLWRAAGGR